MMNQPVILMYHGIVHPDDPFPAEREAGAELYDVLRERFAEQMKYLSDHRYRSVIMPEQAALRDQEVVITFDDGEINNYRQALPILNEYGFKAYFFIIAKRVGKPGYMGFAELRSLINGGMVIGSHGLSHEILTNLNETQMEQELIASKKFLERNLGTEVTSLSIPRGFCNDRVIRMAYQTGYKAIFISDRPQSLTSSCLSRVAIKSDWTLARFEQALRGAVPARERVLEFARKAAKKILRESGYNHLRNILINLFK